MRAVSCLQLAAVSGRPSGVLMSTTRTRFVPLMSASVRPAVSTCGLSVSSGSARDGGVLFRRRQLRRCALGITSGPRGLVGSALRRAVRESRPMPAAVGSSTSRSKVCGSVNALVPSAVVQARKRRQRAATSHGQGSAAPHGPFERHECSLFPSRVAAYSPSCRLRPDSGSNWFTRGSRRVCAPSPRKSSNSRITPKVMAASARLKM